MINEFKKNYHIIQINAEERRQISLDTGIPPDKVSAHKYREYSIRFAIFHIPTQRYIGTAQVIPESCLPPDISLPIRLKKNNLLTKYLLEYPEITDFIGEIRDIHLCTQYKPKLAISIILRASFEICISHNIQLIIMPLDQRIALILHGMGLDIFPTVEYKNPEKRFRFYCIPIPVALMSLQKKNLTLWEFITDNGRITFADTQSSPKINDDKFGDDISSNVI